MTKRVINNMIIGAGSLLDIYGIGFGRTGHDLIGPRVLQHHSDADALQKDWGQVGIDIAESIRLLRPELIPK